MLVALKSTTEPSLRSDTGRTSINSLLTFGQGPITEDLPPLTDDFAPVDHYTATLK